MDWQSKSERRKNAVLEVGKLVIIGLTGPTGAGKSTIRELFGSYGIPGIDADAVYRDLIAPPSPCLEELTRIFGTSILLPDGTLDRKALGKKVFSNAQSLAMLNAVTHRHVMKEIRRRLATLKKEGTPAVVLDAPQLFEAGAQKDCDVIVAVLASPDSRLLRVSQRDGLSKEEILARMDAQLQEDFFRSHADYVLENNTSPKDLIPAVESILQNLKIPFSPKAGEKKETKGD